MDKIKIHEIAKKMNLTSKEILERAKELNIEVKSHLSGVNEEQAKKIEDSFLSKPKNTVKENKKESKKKETKQKDSKKEKTETPVIIRREVIIAEENNKKQNTNNNKKDDKRANNVGFVERKQNKDYNIVYRNKPSKPLTVSELFGLKKEEPVKEEKKVAEKVEIKKEENKKEDVEKENMTATIQNNETENVQVKTNSYPNNRNSQGNNSNRNNNYNRPDGNRIDNRQNNYQNRNDQNNGNQANRNNQNSNGYQANRNNQNNNGYQANRNNQNSNGYQANRNNQNNNGYQGNRNNQNSNGYQGNRNNENSNGYQANRNNQNSNGYQGNRNNQSNGFQNRNGQSNNYQNNRNNGQNNFNNRNNNNNTNNRFPGRRPLDERGIEKNIKDIMAVDLGEKENTREYNKTIDKQKVTNKYDDNKTKKAQRNRKNSNSEFDEGKLKSLKQNDNLSKMFNDDQEGSMLDYYDLTTQRGKKGRKVKKNDENRTKQKIFKLTEITIPDSITVKDLSVELKKTTAEVIKKLLGYGIMATINNEVDFDTAFLVAQEFGITANKKETVTDEDILFDETEDNESELVSRPPVVVVMGHVDHGKTSLLDAIRKTNVIEGEAGGITQAIGAYKVKINDREITFLDTPGHEAFTAMRARGAQITDIAILVVAANDGVMPQTIEAINHAKSAGIPIIVAVNKMDLPDANIEKVKQEMMKYELVPEEWGGDTIYVPISAKNNENIDTLLEMVLLQADVLELKANPKKQAKGVVIEARLDKSKGSVASLLVQRGTLDVGDTIVVGSSIGRIRAMVNDKGKKVKAAGPSTPVSIMGLTEVPQAGDTFYEVKDEKTAKHLIERRKRQEREKVINATTKITLDNLFSQMEQGNLKKLNIIVKADVQGSVEAVKQSLEKLENEEVKVHVIHAATGAVTESDVTLAKVSNAIIIAFNVRPGATAKEMAQKEEVEIKQYSIIYQAIEDVEAAMKGMLEPKFEEKVIGTAEIRQTFKVSNVGTIAGAYVLTGKVERNAGVRIIRENIVIHEGKLASLKRFKDDAKEVAKGFECGIQIEKFNDLKEGDIMEVFVMEEIKR